MINVDKNVADLLIGGIWAGKWECVQIGKENLTHFQYKITIMRKIQ